MWTQSFSYFFIILLISMGSVVMVPFSFLLLAICCTLCFFLISLINSFFFFLKVGSVLHFIYLFIFPFIFISWRLITLQYCSGFCHTLS